MIAPIDDGGSFFPWVEVMANGQRREHPGASKREVLAAMAMAGYRANPNTYMSAPIIAAEWAANDADALLAALKETK